MKYLVTGGCGFIGSHLCDLLLAQEHEVVVLDDLSTGYVENLPKGVALVTADVANAEVVDELMHQVDGCFHLAAVASVERSVNDWAGTHRVNQQGSVNVFNAARANGHRAAVPVVYASSAAIYGDNATTPLHEAVYPRPISAYGVDKLGSELHARVAWLVHGIPTIGMRFFNVYGPRQDPRSPYSGVISIFMDRIINNQPINIYGNGQQTRDFIYVEDVVQHLAKAMASLQRNADVFNVCTGQSTAITQLAKILGMVAGVDVQIQYHSARSGDIATSLGDPAKARAQLGIEYEVDLGEGLKRTLAAYRESQQTAQSSKIASDPGKPLRVIQPQESKTHDNGDGYQQWAN